MDIISIIFLAAALAMDAFGVSVSDGIILKKIHIRDAAKIGLFFGGFQFIMPCIDSFAAGFAMEYIEAFDHWIAFGLLLFLGGKMVYDGIFDKEKKGEEKEDKPLKLGFVTLLIMAVATSIDALAVGVTFAFLKVNVWLAVSIIGATTFTCSLIGVGIGVKVGDKFKNKAEILGGVILILLGVKILLEHLGVISF